ncbi:uncharacterized protein VTP21DRAFT_9903 [Calcarisporiella thermophila]|uniref:uncharacterized protein n=1 Tax=Calcarisporiella thermophila TaxID=911321 RepID=UPI003742C1D5
MEAIKELVGEPICIDDFERLAKNILPPAAYGYYSSGADNEDSIRENVIAFSRWRLRPRVLCDVSNVDTRTSILGHPVSSPICIAPTAMMRLSHPDGEEAVSRAHASFGSAMTVSTFANTSLEDVVKFGPESLYFFQLYVYADRSISQELIRRAEKAGYKALVLTIDTVVQGMRRADVRNRFKLPPHLQFANFIEQKLDEKGIVTNAIASKYDRSLTWEIVRWLRSITKMKIVLKGVMCGEDAALAVQYGVDVVWVSNHGARQLDGVFATIDVLPEVVEAVRGRAEVWIDGGVRLGTDVYKAIALGAQAVFVGRPILYGLAYAGEDGVKRILGILQEELVRAMALMGTPKIKDISRDYVKHISEYKPTPKL